MTIDQFLVDQSGHFLLLLALLAGSAFFSGSETALFSLSRGQLFRMGQHSSPIVRLVPALMHEPDHVLTTVLLGTNVLHILYFIVASALFVRVRGEVSGGGAWAAAMGAAVPLAAIIFSEILPKAICSAANRRLAPLAAPVLAVMGWPVRPLRKILMAGLIRPLTRLLAPSREHRGGLQREEMASLLTLSTRRGIIGANEMDLLREVLELTDLRAGDVMVPRVDMVAWDADGPIDGLLDRFRRTRITRIPIYEGDFDHIVGIVSVRDLLAGGGKGLRELARPVLFVPEAAKLERVLVQMRTKRSSLVIVVEEYGGTAGLLTLEDILEEIVGEMAEQGGAERGPAVLEVGSGEWLVDGDLPAHEWSDLFGEELETARFSTVGGFVVFRLGHIPQVGEQVQHRNVEFTVEAMRGRRISTLRVRVGEAAT